jgi:hypothetical protein
MMSRGKLTSGNRVAVQAGKGDQLEDEAATPSAHLFPGVTDDPHPSLASSQTKAFRSASVKPCAAQLKLGLRLYTNSLGLP